MNVRCCSLVVWLVCGTGTQAQWANLPNSDIYLFEITTNEKGKLLFQNPVRVTKNPMYDNQPWWLPDGSGFLYASVQGELDTTKSDIYKYDLAKNRHMAVLNTARTAEFSPMMMPDKTTLSVVRILEDNTSQVLARCIDKTDECVAIFPQVRNVAYYTWLDANRAVLHLLGDPSLLVVANVLTGRMDTVAVDVGRCLQRTPGKQPMVAFVDKSSKPYRIKLLDGKSGKVSEVVRMAGDGNEDFCFMPDGSLLMGVGTFLLRYPYQEVNPAVAASRPTTVKQPNPKQDQSKTEKKSERKSQGWEPWEKVADLSHLPIGRFDRLAVDPTGSKLAVVVYPKSGTY